jgi:hypothetical protein
MTTYIIKSNELNLLRYSLAAIWLITAVVSFWDAGQANSLGRQWLLQNGLENRDWQNGVIGAGIAWDALLGLLLVFTQQKSWVYGLALTGTIVMTLLATWLTPELWVHPMGPLFKNLVIWAALWILLKSSSRSA